MQKYDYKSMFIVYILRWCGPLVVLHHMRKLILPLHFVSTSLPLFYLIIIILFSLVLPPLNPPH